MAFKKGDRVKMSQYGYFKIGTVTKDQRSSVVKVRWDNGRNGWAHAANLLYHNESSVLDDRYLKGEF